jgi:fibronectin type 3 domain-containing protein
MQSAIISVRSRQFVCGLFLSSVLAVSLHAGQSIKLSWTPAVSTNVAGYKIYYGTQSLSYSNSIAAGNVTNLTVAGFCPGKTYYFSATTYDSAGNESSFASETSYTVPSVPATLGNVARTGGQFSFLVSGNSGSNYVVQASSDLINWVPVTTNTAPFVFTDTNMAAFCKRFYRTAAL